jgi:hypothetical protein
MSPWKEQKEQMGKYQSAHAIKIKWIRKFDLAHGIDRVESADGSEGACAPGSCQVMVGFNDATGRGG